MQPVKTIKTIKNPLRRTYSQQTFYKIFRTLKTEPTLLCRSTLKRKTWSLAGIPLIYAHKQTDDTWMLTINQLFFLTLEK